LAHKIDFTGIPGSKIIFDKQAFLFNVLACPPRGRGGFETVLIRFRNFLTSSLLFAFAEPPMEPSKMEMAFHHVINGRRIVARQRERVERLARNGSDTTEANRTLDLFARTLDIFEEDLRRILEQDAPPLF
jgi:hypothetical protein